ncbi:hypothetical protein Sjap_018048 [Stephania japonica]|uniref:Carbohydrate kinase PfkB domain-containing protein n=1 Tax=Stephania japonica TaxID=461633 RepID=A0AAP0NK53_9MAGN
MVSELCGHVATSRSDQKCISIAFPDDGAWKRFYKQLLHFPMKVFAAHGATKTTGAGDTFTAAFAVALLKGKSKQEYLEFAAAVASLRVQVKGTIPSMPERKAVFDLLGA